jgi:hypothetical protein
MADGWLIGLASSAVVGQDRRLVLQNQPSVSSCGAGDWIVSARFDHESARFGPESARFCPGTAPFELESARIAKERARSRR